MPIGSVEIALPPNGDFSQAANGDLVLVADSTQAPAATVQRLIRLILTNARVVNQTTGSISMPDDPFNVNWGSNARNDIGAPLDDNLKTSLESQIMSALVGDPDVASVPAPTVTVGQIGLDTITVSVVCFTVTGEIVTIPSLPLNPAGA